MFNNTSSNHLDLAQSMDASNPTTINPANINIQAERMRNIRPVREGSIMRYFQPVKVLKRKANGNLIANDISQLTTPEVPAPLQIPVSAIPEAPSALLNTRNYASTGLRATAKKTATLKAPATTITNNTATSSEPKPKREKTEKSTSLSSQKPKKETAVGSSSVKITGPVAPPNLSDSPGVGICFTTPSLSWQQRHGTLLVLTTTSPEPKVKPGIKKVAIAAFDLDSTIVRTKSQTPFPKDGSDWEWFNDSVQANLKAFVQHMYGKAQPDLLTHKSVAPPVKKFLEEKNRERVPYIIAILSNQGGVVIKNDAKRYGHFRERLEQIAAACKIPFWMYAATRPLSVKKAPGAPKGVPPPPKRPDPFRKPATGMWFELVEDVKKMGLEVDHDKSFFVGDAAGRKNDFSDSDREFAKSLQLKFFTPDDFFINNPAPKKSNRKSTY